MPGLILSHKAYEQQIHSDSIPWFLKYKTIQNWIFYLCSEKSSSWQGGNSGLSIKTHRNSRFSRQNNQIPPLHDFTSAGLVLRIPWADRWHEPWARVSWLDRSRRWVPWPFLVRDQQAKMVEACKGQSICLFRTCKCLEYIISWNVWRSHYHFLCRWGLQLW